MAAPPAADRFTILEQDAGLHFLLQVDSPLSGPALTKKFAAQGLKVHMLSSFYQTPTPESDKSLVINYSAVDEAALVSALEHLNL